MVQYPASLQRASDGVLDDGNWGEEGAEVGVTGHCS